MDKLKVRKMGSLELIDAVPELGKDYLLTIRVSRSGTEVDEKDENELITYYVMEYINTEALVEAGTRKKLMVRSGKTQSQKLRWILTQIAENKGEDPEEYYKQKMSEIIDFFQKKLE